MNVFTAIMLVFAAVGVIDKIIGGRFGLSECFDRGLMVMGSMCVPMVGMSCVGVALIQNNTDMIMGALENLPFDPSIIAGVLLPPDMGGFFISEELARSHGMFILNGVVLGSLLGQLITFQIPIFFAAVRGEERTPLLKGFVVGIAVVPVGLAAAAVMLKLDPMAFAAEFIPILLICILMAIGLMKAPDGTIRGFSVFAQAIQIMIVIFFAVTVAGLFIPSIAYVDADAVCESVVIVFRAVVIVAGSLVLSELIKKTFRRRISAIAEKLGINDISVIGLLLGCATSLAILPLISKMDDRGKILNGAFSVSGAYFLGGQMGFVSSVSDGYTVAVMVAAKVICGGLGVFIAYKFMSGRREDQYSSR